MVGSFRASVDSGHLRPDRHRQRRLIDLVSGHWVVVVSVIITLALTTLLSLLSAYRNDGRLIYIVDDAYIHMAMAKNLAQHGVFGVTRYEFSASSSSPLWTALLALTYVVTGVNEVAPLLLNVAAGLALLLLINHICLRHGLTQKGTLVVLPVTIALLPVPVLALIGMEHLLQALVVLALAFWSALVLADRHEGKRSRRVLLCLLSAIAVAVRYESLFLVLVVALLFALRRRWPIVGVLILCSVLPLAITGAISVANGSYLLPNSVLLKSHAPDFDSFASLLSYALWLPRVWLANLNPLDGYFASVLVFLFSAGAALRLGRRGGFDLWDTRMLMLVLFLGTAILHLQFASVGWYGRYEAYLLVFGLTAVGPVAAQLWRLGLLHGTLLRAVVGAVAMGAGLVLLSIRAIYLLWFAVPSTSYIYGQQYQMGSFLREYYQGSTVVMNDIGAINYLADLRCFDVWGLASIEIAQQIRAERYGIEPVAELARAKEAKLAVVYPFAVQGSVPSEWEKVGEWQVSDVNVLGADTVAFYAVDPSEADSLAANLRDFAPKLPRNVHSSVD